MKFDCAVEYGTLATSFLDLGAWGTRVVNDGDGDGDGEFRNALRFLLPEHV